MEPRLHDVYQRFRAANDENQLFEQIAAFARQLGFDYCCYGVRMAAPVSRPALSIFETYPDGWMAHYQASGFLEIDPTVSAGMRQPDLIVWPEVTQGDTSRLWSDARDFGLNVGVAHSSFGPHKTFGLLSISRQNDALTPAELDSVAPLMGWLAHVSHMLMSRFLAPTLSPEKHAILTTREREVLCWTGDGKTSYEIAKILNISERTVNFHVNNVLLKLTSTNKTQAVVKAITMGLLYSC